MIIIALFLLNPIQVGCSPSTSKMKPSQQIGIKNERLTWISLNLTADYITVSTKYRTIHQEYLDYTEVPEMSRFPVKSEKECQFSYKEGTSVSADGTLAKSAVLNCPFVMRVDKTAEEWYQSMYELALTRMHRNERARDLIILAKMVNFNRKGTDRNDPKSLQFSLVAHATIKVKELVIIGKTGVSIYGGIGTELTVTELMIVHGAEVNVRVEKFSVGALQINRSVKTNQGNAVSRVLGKLIGKTTVKPTDSEFYVYENPGVRLVAVEVADITGTANITNFPFESVEFTGNWRSDKEVEIKIGGETRYKQFPRVHAEDEDVHQTEETPERQARITRVSRLAQTLSVAPEEDETGQSSSHAADPIPESSIDETVKQYNYLDYSA